MWQGGQKGEKKVFDGEVADMQLAILAKAFFILSGWSKMSLSLYPCRCRFVLNAQNASSF